MPSLPLQHLTRGQQGGQGQGRNGRLDIESVVRDDSGCEEGGDGEELRMAVLGGGRCEYIPQRPHTLRLHVGGSMKENWSGAWCEMVLVPES